MAHQVLRDPVLYIHQEHTFTYPTAQSMMVLKEILGNYRLAVVTHLCVCPQCKSRYPSQNNPCLDKRTPNPREREAVIVTFTFCWRY